MHPFIVAKIAHTQQSTRRIRYLPSLLVSSIKISVAAACYYRLRAIKISWSNIKNWQRYINASLIYGGQNRSHTTINRLHSITASPLYFIHQILVAAACYYWLRTTQIPWPIIENRRRDINASIYCGQNRSRTTINRSHSITSSPLCFIHRNFGGSGMLLLNTCHSNSLA